MGAVGVGIATAVAQYIAMTMVLYHMANLDDDCKLIFSKLAIDKAALGKMMRIGLPAGLQATFFSLSNALIQSTVNTYPTVVQTGNTTAGNIEGFVYISMNACYHAALTFVGQNTGAKKYNRVLRASLICLGLVTVVGLGMSTLIYLNGAALISIYRPGQPDVVAAGMVRLSVICVTYFLCGIMDVGSGIMRGMGKSFLPMMVSLIGSCMFRIVWIMLLCPGYPASIETLYWSYPISWILTAGVHLICCAVTWIYRVRKLKREQAVLAQQPQTEEQPVEA
jgi:Na+-driven multidrug efflux pump